MKFIDDCLFVASTPLKLAEELAGWVFAQVTEMTSLEKPFYLAISGGNTPVLFFNHMAAKYGHYLNWNLVHFFWVDERCVVPSHNDSNFKNANIHLLSKISIPESNVHRIKGEIDQQKEADDYTSTIKSLVPLKNNIPTFDLILLGMGDDGHTASLFPDQDNVILSDKICETSVNPNTGQKRITLTPLIINNASKIAFYITGMSKAAIVNEILVKQHESDKYPAAHIKPSTGNLYWFLDASAAKGLFE
jgi:6-phosphogluconolactonase